MYKKQSDIYKNHVASVLEFIYRTGQTSRIEIANNTGLTPALMTSITADLMEKEEIMETGDEISGISGSGRKRKLLTLNAAAGYLLGIEINMRGIFIALTDLVGTVIQCTSKPLSSYNVDNINEELVSQINICIEKIKVEKIYGAGIAIPGHFDYFKKTIISNNPLWSAFNLDEISNHFPFAFTVNNNVECMSLGEYLFHASNSPDKFLFYHIGHGLFCSFFNSSQLGIKENSYIGEIGHTVVDINGPVCECGKKGCLQTYISESWLIKTGQLLFDSSPNNILRSLVASENDITIETIIKAYELGDSYFTNKIDQGLKLLSTSIANTLIIQDSEKIYLNSKLFQHLSFKNQIISQIQEQLNFIPMKRNIDIEITEFDNFRGAKGAAALAAFTFFIKNSNFEYHRL